MKLPVPLLDRLKARADRIMSRTPNKVIGEQYLTRWHIIPKNPLFNIYLHHVEGSDPDTHLHDHPWLFNCSIVLRGQMKEFLTRRSRPLTAGHLTARMGRAPHRLVLETPDCVTVFVTGPKCRRWGFYTEEGWVASNDYLSGEGNGRTVNSEFR
ncbi:hypothetical protein I6N98_17090 [Spongiibacter nanhainus]|uniref:Cupin n=1 Tax=Spongiibacter nanhainus TaxID=2794344 RepID=A0A7T4R0F2_9GAMM|nr:hypothetical protein [Spongiibacter nanhainus]QQD18034.1 hypothetical protein I6N98_17090 [Spongiibacter nanhainus]